MTRLHSRSNQMNSKRATQIPLFWFGKPFMMKESFPSSAISRKELNPENGSEDHFEDLGESRQEVMSLFRDWETVKDLSSEFGKILSPAFLSQVGSESAAELEIFADCCRKLQSHLQPSVFVFCLRTQRDLRCMLKAFEVRRSEASSAHLDRFIVWIPSEQESIQESLLKRGVHDIWIGQQKKKALLHKVRMQCLLILGALEGLEPEGKPQSSEQVVNGPEELISANGEAFPPLELESGLQAVLPAGWRVTSWSASTDSMEKTDLQRQSAPEQSWGWSEKSPQILAYRLEQRGENPAAGNYPALLLDLPIDEESLELKTGEQVTFEIETVSAKQVRRWQLQGQVLQAELTDRLRESVWIEITSPDAGLSDGVFRELERRKKAIHQFIQRALGNE